MRRPFLLLLPLLAAAAPADPLGDAIAGRRWPEVERLARERLAAAQAPSLEADLLTSLGPAR